MATQQATPILCSAGQVRCPALLFCCFLFFVACPEDLQNKADRTGGVGGVRKYNGQGGQMGGVQEDAGGQLTCMLL